MYASCGHAPVTPTTSYRGVARGESGGVKPNASLRNLSDQLALLKPGGADYAPQTTTSPPDSKSYLHLCSLIGQMIDGHHLEGNITMC